MKDNKFSLGPRGKIILTNINNPKRCKKMTKQKKK